jgi:hypothetical protein
MPDFTSRGTGLPDSNTPKKLTIFEEFPLSTAKRG